MNLEQSPCFRAFVAISIDEMTREALHRQQSRLQRQGCRLNWVRPENIHLSLAFLGEIPATMVDQLSISFDLVGASVPPFSFAIEGVGCFGVPGRPRVFWADIPNPPKELVRLEGMIKVALADNSLVVDNRLFKPHITLARVRDRTEGAALTSVLRSVKRVPYGSVSADRFLFMQSTLTARGATYTVLHESRLKGVLP